MTRERGRQKSPAPLEVERIQVSTSLIVRGPFIPTVMRSPSTMNCQWSIVCADCSLDFMTMFMSQATFRPIAIGSRRDLEDVGRVMKQHGIRPVIDSVFSFDDAAAAWRHFADRQLFGKVVIRH
jgi:D-arabinose 1-dehydrogenase-like Zn-dependent alcohol dehydrogenase